MRPYSSVVAFVLLVAPASGAFAQADSVADTAPPSQVVKHTVKRGDTLWGIASYYLKDPFSWPTVFHANTGVVKNPHWIYPGQILTIPRAVVRDVVSAQTDRDGFVVARVGTRPADDPTVFLGRRVTPISGRAAGLESAPVYTVKWGEHEAAPFVVDDKHPLGAGRIVGAVERPALGLKSGAGFIIYDRLYVTPPPGLTLKKGDKLLLASRGRVILDVGRVIEPTGILRVDSAPPNGPILGTVIKQFQEILAGNITLEYKQTFQPTTTRPVVGTYDVGGKVLWIRRSPPLPSIQTYVVIGVPAAAQVRPGDQFTLYSQSDRDVAAHIPPVAMAKVQIVRVTPLAATGLIIAQQQPQIEVEMPARLTAKMP